jgi:hypothetical protein
VAVLALTTAARVLKWRYALGSGKRAAALFFLSKSVGMWSPAKVGELAPLAFREHRTPAVAAWIVTDRVVEASATLGTGLAGLVLLGATGAAQLAELGAMAAVLVVVPVLLVTRTAFFEWLEKRFTTGGRLRRLAGFVAEVSREVRRYRTRLPVTTLITLGVKAGDLAVPVLLYRGLGYRLSFPLSAAMRSAHAALSAVPVTPDATGVPFTAAAKVINHFGGIPYEAVFVAMVLEVVALNVVLWGGLALTIRGLRKRADDGSNDGEGGLT